MPERNFETPLPPLIAALQHQLAAELVETHASWVLVAGGLAYKIKKPITLPFLDYGSLALRETACRAELRLNRRLAPQLYLDVLPIGGSPAAPQLDARPAIEWAVRMRRFDGEQQLDRVCARGELSAAQLTQLAQHVWTFQKLAAVATPHSPFGQPWAVLAPAMENFEELRVLLPQDEQTRVEHLATWTLTEFAHHEGNLRRRQLNGFVREGHGDLHLGNLVLLDGVVTAFDGIEFNEEFRWIDVASEIAFTWIDLLDHRRPGLAASFLSAWRETSGDAGALTVMRFYAVYRAVVRAKVAAIRAAQNANPGAEPLTQAREYLRLAQEIAVPGDANSAPTLTITVGLSGAGKTTASNALLLADATGACLRLRSDVERKRLFGLAPLAASQGDIYSDEATARTYAKLRDDAKIMLAAGWSVIVDAACLKRAERRDFRELAAALGCGFRILHCDAPEAELRQRLRQRSNDASEATEAVLDKQLAWFEPLDADERAVCITSVSANP